MPRLNDSQQAAFERFLAEHEVPPAHRDDVALAFAALAADPVAVAELEAAVNETRPHVARIRGGAPFFDDVRQKAMEHLLTAQPPRLREYSGQGPLRAWLRAVTVRLAIDLQRKEGKSLPEDELGNFIRANAASTDPLKQLTAQRVGQAIRSALDALNDRDRALLRLHHLEGATLDALATMYSAHRATVARWLADARAQVLQQTRQQLLSALGGDELDSALASVASMLDVSFRQLLEPPRDS